MRQGNLVVTRITDLPASVLLEEQPSQVILEDQRTGYAHRLTRGVIYRSTVSSLLYLVVALPAQIVHERHDPMVLEPGIYRVTRFA